MDCSQCMNSIVIKQKTFELVSISFKINIKKEI